MTVLMEGGAFHEISFPTLPPYLLVGELNCSLAPRVLPQHEAESASGLRPAVGPRSVTDLGQAAGGSGYQPAALPSRPTGREGRGGNKYDG